MTPQQLTRLPVAAILALSLIGAPNGHGQPPFAFESLTGEGDTEAPPVFEVEVLIFAYNEFNAFEENFAPEMPHWPESLIGVTLRATPETLPSGSAEWYLEDVLQPAEPAFDAGGDAPADPTDLAAAAAPASAAIVDEYGNTVASTPAVADDGRWYRMLEQNELQLGRAFARLNALGAYTPLVHVGWSQKTFYEEEAQPFELAWLGKLEPAGTIRLHRSRFLHLTLDISMQNDYVYHEAPLPPDARWPLAEFMGPVIYRIDVQRRVRSGEVHFFDHPAFGALIAVRPAPEPAVPDGSVQIGPAA